MESILTDKLSKILFHGTLMNRAENIINNGIDFGKLNIHADFGKGFYVTDSYALAKNTALLRYKQELFKNSNVSAPVVLKLKLQNADYSKWEIKEFKGENLEWKKFICTNRWYEKVLNKHPDYDHNTNSQYDIVLGLTADGIMSDIGIKIKEDHYDLSTSFLKVIRPFKTTYMKTIWGQSVPFETKAYQISFHNKDFIDSCIRYKGYDILTIDEKEEWL